MKIIKNLNLPVLFFSLEMSKEQLTYRLLTHETLINSNRLKTGNLYQEKDQLYFRGNCNYFYFF